MDAGRPPPGQGFHPQRKWRLFLARPRPPLQHPPLRSVPRGLDRRRRGPHPGAIDPVPVHLALSDSVRSHRSSPEEITNIMKAVFVEQPGGPENLKYAEQPKPEPGPGQALVKIAAAGVNYIDVYFRTGLYPATPPVMLGNEGAGTVETVAPDVQNISPGDRVAYAMAPRSYAK